MPTPAHAARRYQTERRYTDRESKAAYIADKYRAILAGSVLDVGCDTKRLRPLVARPDLYVGVDLCDAADVVIDLDREALPFGPGSFDTVVCTDVLEHLADPHGVFDHLCTIARGHLVISLPNPVKELLWSIWQGSGGRLKYYGLPVDPPADRHRWFFGYAEAERFLRERGARNGWVVEQCEPETTDGLYWLNGSGEDVLADPNIRWGTLWCVLARAPEGGGSGEGARRAG